MQPLLLVSSYLLERYGTRIEAVLRDAPRRLDILPFAFDMPLTAGQINRIEAAFYSYEIWAGTVKTHLSPQSAVFWPIVDSAPHLRWVQVFSAGSDQQRYQHVLSRGVRLTTSAGVNAGPVALTAFTGLLAIARGFPQWLSAQRRHAWLPLQGKEMPRDMRGQTAIIFGTGPIGSAIARHLHSLGVCTWGVRRSGRPAEHFDKTLPLCALDDALPSADWLVLAGPLTPETRGLIDARRFALLPRGAGFVNVSRGEIVDEVALIDALRSGHLRGAYLDVFATEPLPSASRFWDLPNVLMSPHNAAASDGYIERGVALFLRNLARYLAGGSLVNES
ncbi:MAG: D-2-hydroxyacid dehydrogenase [Burkholderiales bacterium]